jgi:hypothetical protein
VECAPRLGVGVQMLMSETCCHVDHNRGGLTFIQSP